MENSKIEWTTHTFNPWVGCTKVSPGCANCYAEHLMDHRLHSVKWGKGRPRNRTSKANWDKVRQWNRAAEGLTVRPRVFCASLADWLDEEIPVDWRADLFGLILETQNLDWLLLTKRPENFNGLVLDALAYVEGIGGDWPSCRWPETEVGVMLNDWTAHIAPDNVWIGTSAEDQQRWNERVPALMDIPADVHFVSAEPLLGTIHMGEHRPEWLIVGGESGPHSRDMEAGWVRDLRDECSYYDIPFLFKQWGGTDKKATGRELDGRTWDGSPANAMRSQPADTGETKEK